MADVETNNDNQFTSYSSLSDSQEMLLSSVLVTSAIVSVFGSSCIVTKIYKKRKRPTSYDRIMVTLSLSDILQSVTFGLTPFLMPKNSRVWSFGTKSTCSALGFLTQLSFSVVGINLILSIYFLLTIKFGMKRDKFAKHYEKPLQIFNTAYFFITSTIGLMIGVYSPVDIGFGCWVNDYPKGCENIGNCRSVEIAFVFLGVPAIITLSALLINNLMIYLHVRKTFNDVAAQHNVGMTAEEAVTARKYQRGGVQQDRQIRLVATQGFLYVACFLFCYTAPMIMRIKEAKSYNPDDAGIYPVLVISAFTLPLQGFLNMLIYNRPAYIRIRDTYPELNFFQALRKACLPNAATPSPDSLSSEPIDVKKLNKFRGLQSKGSKNFSSSLEIVQEGEGEEEEESHHHGQGNTNNDNMKTRIKQNKYEVEKSSFWGSNIMSEYDDDEEEDPEHHQEEA